LRYFDSLDYTTQLEDWKSKLSKKKLQRYNDYCKQRKFYKMYATYENGENYQEDL